MASEPSSSSGELSATRSAWRDSRHRRHRGRGRWQGSCKDDAHRTGRRQLRQRGTRAIPFGSARGRRRFLQRAALCWRSSSSTFSRRGDFQRTRSSQARYLRTRRGRRIRSSRASVLVGPATSPPRSCTSAGCRATMVRASSRQPPASSEGPARVPGAASSWVLGSTARLSGASPSSSSSAQAASALAASPRQAMR
jgi:hypothetical protein